MSGAGERKPRPCRRCTAVVRRATATALLLTIGLALVLAAPSALGAADALGKLRRPLHLPRLAPGERCPVTPLGRANGWRAQGPGPVYPVGAYPALWFSYPPTRQQLWYGSRWSGQKILWIARPSYRGPVLIRGRRLDGPEELRFERGLNPEREMLLKSVDGSSGTTGWQNRPSFTRLRAAGCYAWQVDGPSFSRVIVFRARVSPN
jgi:hypothetical protein